MHRYLPVVLATLSPVASAAVTIDAYVAACAANPANRMDTAVCTCVGNDTLQAFGQAGLEYMHAKETRDSTRLHQAMAGMNQQQKTGIMMHVMLAPSKCAGKVARPPQETAGDGGSAAGSASGAATASGMEGTTGQQVLP